MAVSRSEEYYGLKKQLRIKCDGVCVTESLCKDHRERLTDILIVCLVTSWFYIRGLTVVGSCESYCTRRRNNGSWVCRYFSADAFGFKDVDKTFLLISQHHVGYHTDHRFLWPCKKKKIFFSDFFSVWHLWLLNVRKLWDVNKKCPLKQLTGLKTVGGSNLRSLHSDMLTRANRTSLVEA